MTYPVTPVRLSREDIKMIDTFVKLGEFRNRSEFIRFAIKYTLLKFMEKVTTQTLLNSKEDDLEFLKKLNLFKEMVKEYEECIKLR
ncbi:MAG: ribbon-helix-helix domain-containing protein [Candidatus Asgardarchaeia archaeon]